jgi:O-antigen ligase
VWALATIRWPTSSTRNAREWEIARGFRDSHNTYLTIAAETGLPGSSAHGGAVISLLVSCLSAHSEREAPRRDCHDPVAARGADQSGPPALIAGLLAFLVTAVFGSLFLHHFPFLYAVVPSMASFSLERARRRDRRAGSRIRRWGAAALATTLGPRVACRVASRTLASPDGRSAHLPGQHRTRRAPNPRPSHA